MTVRAIAGLVLLNVGFAVMGTSLLWALRGFARWSDALRLGGLGYLLGVAAFGTLWTQFLVVGVPFGGWGVILTLVGGTVAASPAGVRLGRPRPRGFAGPRSRFDRFSLLVTATGVALVGLLLEAFFRSARLQSLQAFDAWAFWVPKAKAIYFFGGLDEQVFTTSAGPTYPPLVPIVDAAAFHAMGSADTVTFHLQFWFLVTGAVVAIAGCLYRHAPAWALWPSILLVLVVPRFGERLMTPQADVLVDVLFVVGALLLGALAARLAGLAPRGHRRPLRRGDADEARGPALRGACARGCVRGELVAEASGVACARLGGRGRGRGGRPLAAVVPVARHRR